MAESQADRVKAAKLRARATIGKKPLTADEKRWLETYELRTKKASNRAKAVTGHAASSPPRPTPRPTVSGEQQLLLPGDGPVSSAVQQTKPLDDTIDPQSTTWTPTMPAAPADAPPPPPGTPPTPEAGTPLVDNAAPAPKQGGPKTALAFAALVDYVLTAGLKAADELLVGVELPEMLRNVDTEDGRKQLHTEVQNAAARMSIAHGWTWADGVASDDGIVIGTVVASGAAVLANRVKQKKLAAAQPPKPDEKPEPAKAPVDATIAAIFADGGGR